MVVGRDLVATRSTRSRPSTGPAQANARGGSCAAIRVPRGSGGGAGCPARPPLLWCNVLYISHASVITHKAGGLGVPPPENFQHSRCNFLYSGGSWELDIYQALVWDPLKT